ncbi:nitrilase-related carbon-nitrogen hydrolase [Desulfobacula toluolica]|uniref:Nitrilase/cyanide hydratase and apolipoprotein N-acyltransferase n=1 Tax=Desulfobacula toluolica (strain DSM 7467 / Tol2) TaxID=651182 RepID=K0NH76_DESTT|nr:nitrilase-related carbon-nitrogen hydrolase [Desulfobacula toluolica]CCK80586.1 nitrilase/cyanide hydratase and apolipoprotein N-acyltransferase [Desulfobacula toluolica Tol2]
MSSVKAALIVQNCIAGNFKKNLESSLSFISSAALQGADIIVFPEMNLTGYVSGPDIVSICQPISKDIVTLFSNMSQDLKITILVGLAEKTPDKKIYASHLVFKPSGSFERYRKIHTSPFEKKYFTPGDKIPVFKSQGLNFGVQLCYDAHFPELSLAMALKKADIIFIPHASPRGSSQEKYDSWLRHLRARAFDNGLYIAACNQTGDNTKGLLFPGISLLIGPDGNVIYKSIDGAEGIHMIRIEKELLNKTRSHKMKYFLPNRRCDLFNNI